MPIIKSSEDFDWGNNVAVLDGYRASTREYENMLEKKRKLMIVDLTPEQQAEIDAREAEEASQKAQIVSEGDLKAAALKAKAAMTEEVKEKLRALKNDRKAKKAAIKAQFAGTEIAKEKKSKLPVFKDPAKQAEILAKFPWVIPGSFSQDPEKSGGTLLNIKCQMCSDERNIHLADSFHTKLCKECKKNGSKSKMDKQSASRPSGQPGTDSTSH